MTWLIPGHKDISAAGPGAKGVPRDNIWRDTEVEGKEDSVVFRHQSNHPGTRRKSGLG